MDRRNFFKYGAVGAGTVFASGTYSSAWGQSAKGQTQGSTFSQADMNVNIKIDQIESFHVKGARGRYPIVRIKTNQGIEGIGECQSWGHVDVPGIVRSIGSQLYGANPLRVNSFLEQFAKQDTGLGWYAAISGIEIALWDILGQVAGVPVCALLGGQIRDRVRLYANHGIFEHGSKTLEDRIERVLQAKSNGYTMFKWDPTTPYGPRGNKDVSKIINEVKAFREAVGDDFDLGIDAHNNLSIPNAFILAKELEPFRLAFFEAPFVWQKHNGEVLPELLKKIAETTSVPIAEGEWMRGLTDAKRIMDYGGVGVLQPEIGLVGGMMMSFKMASLANAYGVTMAPHHWAGAILAYANAHVSAVIPNLLAQEYGAAAPEAAWESELLKVPLVIEDGHMVVPNVPGLGAKLNEKVLSDRRLD